MSAAKMLTIAHVAPANDPPAYRTTESIATEFGFKSARAVRDWCRRRKIPYHRDGGYNWVDKNLVQAAIARGPVHVVPAEPATPTVASWVDATLGGVRHGS